MSAVAHEIQPVQVTVRMDSALRDAVKAFAFATDTSANTVMVSAIADFIAADARRETVEAFFRQALDRHKVLLDKLD
jgi:predicted transcriptional regulator